MRNFINIIESSSSGINLTDEQRARILADPRVRRGTKIGINTPLWRGQDGDEGSGFASFGAGFYFTADKSYAKKYGKVSEVSRTNLPDNPLRFDSLNDFQIWRGYVYKILDCNGRDFAEHYYDFGDFIRDLDPSFDGMQIYNGRDAVFVLYPETMTEGVGKIVKGVNTTQDVGVDQTEIEAAKFGFKVGKNGPPQFEFGKADRKK